MPRWRQREIEAAGARIARADLRTLAERRVTRQCAIRADRAVDFERQLRGGRNERYTPVKNALGSKNGTYLRGVRQASQPRRRLPRTNDTNAGYPSSALS